MILDIQFKNNKKELAITINSRSHDIDYIYLDSFENRKNYNSRFKNDHDHIIYQGSMKSTVDGINKTYSLTSDLLKLPRITRLWIMTIVYTDGEIENRIVYDLLELYCVRMNIIKMCNPCGDTANHKMLTVLMFREMLLRNAIGFNHITEALQYYEDIFRPFREKTEVNTCIDGLCSLR